MSQKANNSTTMGIKNQISRQKTSQTIIPQSECYYCLMKQKFNVGNSSQAKCLQHSIKNKSSESKNDSIMSLQQILLALKRIQYSIQCHYQSEKQTGNFFSQYSSIWYQIKKIDQRFLRMFNQSNSFLEVSQLQNNKHNLNVGSQKQMKQSLYNIQYFDPNSFSDVIKQWVIYFHRILVKKTFDRDKIYKQDEPLTGQQNLDLNIFKQSMQRKFMLFVANLNRAQGKLQDALQKLLFYMQKCQDNGIVEHQKIEEDISYLQEDHHYQNIQSSRFFKNDQSFVDRSSCLQMQDQQQSSVQRIIIAQCLSIQALIHQNQILNAGN